MTTQRHATVAGLGSVLPERIVPNAEFERYVDTSDEWIRDRTGIKERHFAADGETTSDLAVRAGRIALGIAAPAFDVNAACAGFSYALSTATAFIGSGQAETILVTGAEVLSRVMDLYDRGTCILFGDGAGAVVLRRSEAPGVLGSVLGADGTAAGILLIPAGGSRMPASRETVDAHDHAI